jgi:hypothetical protein
MGMLRWFAMWWSCRSPSKSIKTSPEPLRQGSNGHKGKPTPQEAVKAGEDGKADILDREIIDDYWVLRSFAWNKL